MSLFFMTFIIVYGGMEAYFFAKLRYAFPRATALQITAAVFLVVMFAAPFLGRWLDKINVTSLARFITIAGFSWLGIMFWFLILFLAMDIYNIVVRVSSYRLAGASDMLISPRTLFLAGCLIVTMTSTWGVYEAANIKVRRFEIKAPKLSREITIAQISDVHLDMIVGSGKLEKIKSLLRDINPDVIVSTGDLVDGSIQHIEHLHASLAEISAPLGKFAVMGNHERYAGYKASGEFLARAGFTVLHGESVVVEGPLRIAGVDDPGHGGMDVATASEVLPNGERETTVLLQHRPQFEPESLGRFDLQLSGHTHGGQIFPFGLIVQFFVPYNTGMHNLPQNSKLYVNPGTGTWGPPIRVLAPPEITVFILKP